ncbi:hypothetical protein ACFFMM_28905 [Micromonospora chaiyaphumensis]|uniref:hypothetical protein n=1 Tax=Micromonospora chaiyaphumensis TaxID=307119 RepID=UPI0011130ACB|nr:hypothetical protein [Micromonospora chaiyaphumensis]
MSSTVLATSLTVVQTNGPVWWVLWWLPVLIAAYPFIFVDRRQFFWACLESAVLILVLAVLGFWFLLFLHLPAALVLLAAMAADPRQAPERARVAVVIGGLLAATATTLHLLYW